MFFPLGQCPSPHHRRGPQDWLSARQVQMIEPTYSPDLAPADFFLFPKLKMLLVWPHPDPGHLQEHLGGGHQNPEQQGCGAGAGRSRNFWLEPEPVY
jgi:hypothetical protein